MILVRTTFEETEYRFLIRINQIPRNFNLVSSSKQIREISEIINFFTLNYNKFFGEKIDRKEGSQHSDTAISKPLPIKNTEKKSVTFEKK